MSALYAPVARPRQHNLPSPTAIEYQARWIPEQSGRCGVQRRHLSLPGIDRPAGSLVTMLNVLSQQSHNVITLKSTNHADNVPFARVSNIRASVLEVQSSVHSTV